MKHKVLKDIDGSVTSKLGVTKRNSLGRTKVNEQYKYHEANYGFHLGFSSSTK